MREKKKQPALDMVYGRVPPQSVETEKSILGSIMLDREAFDIASEIITADSFYAETHQRIFRAMQSLKRKNSVIDILTIKNELTTSGEIDLVGGPYEIAQLTNAIISSASIEHHARIVQEKYIGRRLITLGGEMVQDGYEQTDVFDLIEKTEKRFTEITAATGGKGYTDLSSALFEGVKRIHQLKEQGSSITGIPSDFKDIDAITHGWQPTDLIILAARPSVGKTALALNIARSAARKVPVAIFSMEMSRSQLIQRFISSETELPLENISNGQLTDEQFKTMYERLQSFSSAEIYIDDTAAMNIFELRAACRRMKRKHGVGLVIIDYLQLMSGTNPKANRETNISEISRELKKVAKELELPVIALSQLSRAPEARKGDNKMPQLSDLRESGAIEQDADMVMFLYRPEYHGQNTNEVGESNSGETFLKFAKHRNGKLGVIKLQAHLAIQKFRDYDYMGQMHISGWKPVEAWNFEPKREQLNDQNDLS